MKRYLIGRIGQALRHPAVLAEAGRGGEDDGHADSS